MKKAIGGYFELGLTNGKHWHENVLHLNTGRNAFEYILRIRGYKKVYLPYYTCEVLLEPLKKLHLSYEFYHIDEYLEPSYMPILEENATFLYTNYYGLKQSCVEKLALHYGNSLIVDNAQAFYANPISGIDTFYSPRKFFGLPDGGYAYVPQRGNIDSTTLYSTLSCDQSWSRMSHLLKRLDVNAEFGFEDFHNNSKTLINQPLKTMSLLTETLLKGIDYESAKQKRLKNFEYLHTHLRENNQLTEMLDSFQCSNDSTRIPMIYPYWIDNAQMRMYMIRNKIYVPTYWNNVQKWCTDTSLECELMKNLIPLPIDQRYGVDEMKYIVSIINQIV